MLDNEVLQAIRSRRSVRSFAPDEITDDQLEAILEAGRWAPSKRNSQPWSFVVVREPQALERLADILRRVTWAWAGFKGAPVMIVVSVDPSMDREHFVEDGAIAAQHLCLAAESLGLASSWAGVHAHRSRDRSTGRAIKRIVGLPRSHRVIAVIPIGVPERTGKAIRRPLADTVHYDRFSSIAATAPEVSSSLPASTTNTPIGM